MLNWKEAVIIAALAASLIVTLEHYWVPNKLHQTLRYVLGTLAINLPVTAVLIYWQAWPALILLWSATAAAGVATVASYLVDHWRALGRRMAASEREGAYLREVADGQSERQL